MKSRFATVVGILGLASMACGVRTKIGDMPDSGSPSYSTLGAGGSGTCAPLQDPNDRPFAPPAGASGTWTGYFESTSLAVGDDAIKLTIDQAADGSNQIHVVFGNKPAPAPATSATDRYPPDLSALIDPPSPGAFDIPPIYFMPGFSYPTHEVQWIGQRLKFGVAIEEAWDSWCKLQKSYWVQQAGSDQRSYSCIPGSGLGGGYDDDGGLECFALLYPEPNIQISCDQASLCSSRYCQCDECGCSSPVVAPAHFDITFDGDVATGSGPQGNTGTASLRLMRSPS